MASGPPALAQDQCSRMRLVLPRILAVALAWRRAGAVGCAGARRPIRSPTRWICARPATGPWIRPCARPRISCRCARSAPGEPLRADRAGAQRHRPAQDRARELRLLPVERRDSDRRQRAQRTAARRRSSTALPKKQDAKVQVKFTLGPLYHLRNITIDGELPASAAGTCSL